MAATAGYQAGSETNQTIISYGMEATWGTKPAVAFQAIRYTGETLSLNKTRARPSEINATREVSQAVTTQQIAQGSVNIALSFATFDDWFSIALNQDFQALQVINGIAGDITFTTSGKVLSSTLTTKFANIAVGQWIQLLGFTNTSNNGVWYVNAKADNSHLSLTSPRAVTTETPALTAAKVRASVAINGSTFKSMWMQNQLISAANYLEYPGAYVSRATLQGSIGNLLTGSFDIIAQNETTATSNQSTGAVTAAPTGPVNDPAVNFRNVLWNQAALSSGVDQFSLTIENTGAAAEFALGNVGAAGMLAGTFQATGSFRAFFKTFTEYNLFANETQGNLAFISGDGAGNAYVFSFTNAGLSAASVDSAGPGQAVYATFNIEGNPQSAGGTFQIDRLAGS